MATNACVVSGTLPQANSGTVDLTSSGFGTVDAAIVIMTQANTTNNPEADLRYGVAFWDGSSDMSTASTSVDAVGTTNALRIGDNTDARWSGSTPLTYDISAVTDGIRLTKSGGTASVDYYVTAVMITGAPNSSLRVKNLGTGTSAQTITPGYKADLVIAACVGANSDTQNGNHAIHSLGFAHNNSSDTVTQGAIYASSRDGQTTSFTNSRITNSYIAAQLFNDSVTWQASVGNFTSTTYDITCTSSAGSDRVYLLEVELADPDDAWVTVIDAATGTGNDAHTGAGFQPEAVFLASEGSTSLDSTAQSRAQSFGASDGTTHFVHFFHDEDNVSTTNANSEYSSSNVLHVTDDAGTDDYIASMSSLDSDGFTLTYSDAATAASKILVLAIGDSTAGGGGGGSILRHPGMTGRMQDLTGGFDA